MERQVRLTLLGGFVLVCDGEEMVLPAPSARLLAFLAAQGRPAHRRDVARTLWPDAEPTGALSMLAGALWPLRRPGLLLVRSVGDHLSVTPELTTDLRDAMEAVRRILTEGGDPRFAGVGREALSSDVLPEWDDSWAVAERERFRELRLAALARFETRGS